MSWSRATRRSSIRAKAGCEADALEGAARGCCARMPSSRDGAGMAAGAVPGARPRRGGLGSWSLMTWGPRRAAIGGGATGGAEDWSSVWDLGGLVARQSSQRGATGQQRREGKKGRCNYVYVTVLTSNYVRLDFFFAICLDAR